MIGRVAIIVGAALILAAAPAVRAQSGIAVQTQRSGGVLELSAQATIEASPALVWQVISDYERLPHFIPGLRRSVILSRDGNRLVVEQSGEAGFFIFTVPIEVRLEVQETPLDTIVSRSVGGNVRRMSGRYDIRRDATSGAVILHYTGVIEPGFDLPPFFGMAVLQLNVEAQFEAMVREIRRRALER